jgi:cytochrome c-type biogenesis protein CcmH/NrfG
MKKILLIALVGILAAAGLWFGRSAYRKHKEKRAVHQAQQFLEQKEFAKAMLSARQALQTNPNNADACRVMAVIAEAAGSPNALDWRKRIAEIEPTLDNKLIVASCALRFESAPFPTTQSTLQKIANEATNNASYHVVASQLALQLNNRTNAEFHLSEAVRLDPKNDGNRLNLAAVRLSSKDAETRSAARKVLEQLRSNETFGPEALRWLARDSADHNDFETALKCSDELLAKTNSVDADRFEHLTLLQRAKKPEFNNYLASLQSKAETNATEIYKIAAWEIASGNPDGVLEWLNTLPKEMQAKRPVPVARADALAAMKKWSVLTDFLTNQKWEEQEFLRLALLAHSLRMQKDDEFSKANWNRAVRAASENAEQISVLTQLAGKWGWEDETESLLWILADKFPAQSWALESLNRVYEARENTTGLLRVYEAKLRKNPSDNLSKNNVAMISLLLKTNLVVANSLAEQVYNAEPKNWGFLSTYAYSLHLQGKSSEALQLLQTLTPEQLKQPALATYYAVFLAAVGDKDKARQYAALAKNAPSLPEEKKLLQNVEATVQ